MPALPTFGSCWSRSPTGARSSTTTKGISTSGTAKAAAMPPSSSARSVTRAFSGDRSTVNACIRQLKQGTVPPPLPWTPPKLRRAPRWITTDPAFLRSGEMQGLKEIRAVCPERDATVRHVRDFAALMHERRGDGLPAWIEQVRSHNLPHLHQFADGLERDKDAVIAGLSSHWSSGQVVKAGHQGQTPQTGWLRPSQPRPPPHQNPPQKLNLHHHKISARARSDVRGWGAENVRRHPDANKSLLQSPI